MALKAYIKGWTGELRTKLAQKLFLDKQYHIFNNIIIQSKSGSTQVDHVIVSKYGVFVVETKNKEGWIFGDPMQDQWTQIIFNKKYRFQNPLRQNYAHTKSLENYLKIDPGKIHSLIIFWGSCEFKTPMPDNVLNNSYTPYIKSKKQCLLTEDEVELICSELKKVKDSMGFISDWHHVRDVKRRYESTTVCPKCGGNLLERTSHTGKRAGQQFIGCENYPRCHYTKEL